MRNVGQFRAFKSMSTAEEDYKCGAQPGYILPYGAKMLESRPISTRSSQRTRFAGSVAS